MCPDPAWPPGPDAPALGPGEVHVWLGALDADDARLAALQATLDADERRRAARLRRPVAQRRFVVAHGMLRDVLARYLRIPPGAIRFRRAPGGKPVLDPPALQFNLSDSHDLVLCGVAVDRALGVDVERVRRGVFLAASLLVGAAVAVSGMINFVGLIVPHLLRLVLGPDLRLLLPASFLGGAVFLIWADTAARTALGASELPVGVVTALLGGPFFLFLLRRALRREEVG